VKPADAVIAQGREVRAIERGRLFRKYLVLILALVCGALLISGAVGLYFSYQENKVALSSLQREKAVAAAARVEDYMRQIEHQLVDTHRITSLLARGGEGIEQRRNEFFRLQRLVPDITDVAQVDPSGRELLSVSRLRMEMTGVGEDHSKDPAFREAKPGQTWFGPVYFRKETEPYMTIAVRSSAKGILTVADINLKFIWDVVTRIKVGKKGKAYVVDGTGHLVADPDIGLVLRKTDLSRLPQVRYALDKGDDTSQALIAPDAAGRTVFTAYAPIESLGWKVFVEQPISEVYATLNAAILRTVSLLIAGLLFSALAAMWLARSMVRPIRTLQEGAARIGAGDLEQKIDIHTGDELEALAAQFNQMSAQLRESYAGLERKVEERTAELQETLERQTATAEILSVMSESPTDVAPVFETILSNAVRLSGSPIAAIFRYDGANVHLAATRNWSKEALAYFSKVYPSPPNPALLSGRTILGKSVVRIADTHADPDYDRASAATGHWRRMLGVPMLREGNPVGAFVVAWTEPGETPEHQTELLKTFADQAAIAIENVRLFNEIQDKSRQLEIANQHKSDFLANMSHELRTPLNAIIGFSEVLIEKMFGEVNEKQLDYLNDIHSSGKHLLSLINDILDLSKIEAGRMELDVGEFDVRGALQNALTLVKERAQRSGVELALEVDPALGAFRADERKFKQIMLNLLSNAVKFTPAGGKVSVRARPADSALEVAVADTGVGIVPEDQEAVFEEFRQVGRDYTKKAEGTGLGLALVRKFVELHGGAIRLESAPGKGSTFTFTIPNRP